MYPNLQTLPVGFILYHSQVCCTKAASAFLFLSLAEVYNLTIENASQSLCLGSDLLGLLSSLFSESIV